MPKKKSRVPKSGPVWHRTAEQATLDQMPKYNAHACGTGAHGDAKYNRTKQKRNWQRDLDREDARTRGRLPYLYNGNMKGAKTMRLFIAAELPDEVAEALAETSAMLRGCMRGRYVAPDSFHVTLAFLGDVETARVNDAIDALEEGCRSTPPIAVSLGGVGSFGRRSKATLWQGFRDASQLQDLAQSVRSALRQRGIPFDDKPFRAHVTLMRAADLSKGTLPAPALADGRIERVTLFKSDLSGPRPVYEPLHSAELR